MSARTLNDILKDVEQPEIDEEVDRILAMTPEQRRRRLEASGVDLEALHAKADAFYSRLHGKAGAPARAAANMAAGDGGDAWTTVVPMAPRRRIQPKWVMPFAAALGAAAVGATVAVPTMLAHKDEQTVPTETATSFRSATSDSASFEALSAHRLREQAMRACTERRWGECLDGLSAAARLDPQGDADARVQSARQRALQELRAQARDRKTLP